MVSAKTQQANGGCSALAARLCSLGGPVHNELGSETSSHSETTAVSLAGPDSSSSLGTSQQQGSSIHSCGSQPWLATNNLQHPLQRTKSLKRKAAEALLSGRYSSSPAPPAAVQPAAGPTLSPPSAAAQQPPLQALQSADPALAQPPVLSPPGCSCTLEPQPELPNPHFPTFATSGLHAINCSRSASLGDPGDGLAAPQGPAHPSLHSVHALPHPLLLQPQSSMNLTSSSRKRTFSSASNTPPQPRPSHPQQPNAPPQPKPSHPQQPRPESSSPEAKRQRIEPSQQLQRYQQQLQQLQRQQQEVYLRQQQQQQWQHAHASIAAAPTGTGTFVPAPEATARSHRLVPACPPTCPTHSSWCNFDVRIPHVDWDCVFQDSPSTYSYSIISKGFDKYYMGQGLAVYMVDNPAHAPEAIARLRASMQDPVITIDLEWKPEFKAGQSNQVALMQLSSSTVCVLMHVSSMGFKLPQAVKDLLADPNVQILGFGWDTADEKKMQGTFDMGRSNFANFLDLQEIAKQLSFPSGMGLFKLTKQVLGHEMTKSKAVTRSNWSLRYLSLHQIKYAAMDVFACGQVFRALRLWHSSPSACPGCHELVGALLPPPILQCPSTKRVFKEMRAYVQNAEKLKVPAQYMHCQTCGRYVRNSGAQKEEGQPSG